MTLFLWNLLLAIFWAAITGELSLGALAFGFMVGYIVLFLASRTLKQPSYFQKTRLLIAFVIFVAYELVKSSLRIAFDILTPKHRMRPGIVKIPLDANTDLEITLLANLISLTPGTLTIDISEDRRHLYMHVMYIHKGGLEAVRKHIKRDFEHRVLELLR